LRYKNRSIISIRYESPFSDTSSQQQILQKKSDTDSGFLAYGAVIDLLRPIADSLQIENSFVKFLFSAKLRYDKEIFVGKAIAKRAFRFVQADARITSGSLEREFSLDKSEDISAGEQLGFETEFTNQVLTFSVSPYFRIGAYSNSWLRPSSLDNDFLVVKTEAPVIFETEFKSQGVILELGREQNAEGFNLNIHLKYGVDNEIQTAIRDFTHQLESNQELDYYSVGAEAWFNYEPQNIKGFYAKIGGLIDYREWDIGYKEHDYSLSLDRERLFKVYAQIGYIF